jgi:hypothetical protein
MGGAADAFPVIGCVVEPAHRRLLGGGGGSSSSSLGGSFGGPCGRIAALLPFASEVASAREAAAAFFKL